jgi:hypothetical protein
VAAGNAGVKPSSARCFAFCPGFCLVGLDLVLLPAGAVVRLLLTASLIPPRLFRIGLRLLSFPGRLGVGQLRLASVCRQLFLSPCLRLLGRAVIGLLGGVFLGALRCLGFGLSLVGSLCGSRF